DTTAEHAVQFPALSQCPRRMAFFDTVQLTAPVPFLLFRFAECSPARGLFMHQLLLHLVPCTAVRAFSSPFRRLISAGHTFKYIFRFSHQALFLLFYFCLLLLLYYYLM